MANPKLILPQSAAEGCGLSLGPVAFPASRRDVQVTDALLLAGKQPVTGVSWKVVGGNYL